MSANRAPVTSSATARIATDAADTWGNSGSGEDAPSSRPVFVIVSGNLNDLLRFRGRLVSQLVISGYRVILATPDGTSALINMAEVLGAEHKLLRLSRTGTNPAEDVKSIVRAIAWFREVRPTAVFADGAKAILVGISAAWANGIRRRYAMLSGLGYAFVNDGSRSLRRGAVRTVQLGFFRMLFRGCRSVVFHNSDDMKLLRKLGVVNERNARVTPGSGIDTDAFPASEVPVEPVRFLFLGRLLRSKGVLELLAASKQLKAACPTAEVHIAGAIDNNPDAVSEATLREHHEQGFVVLHGQVSDVGPLLRSSSAFVLPSYREGLPRSALEALASGRTVIVTDTPGCREVVDPPRYGEMVPVRDAESLAEAMIRYAQDPDRLVREGRAARRAAEERFDVQLVVALMLNALEVSAPDTSAHARL